MRVNCPQCRAEVAAANISLETGWAKCTACNEVFALADVVDGFRTTAEPPPALERPFDAWARLERADRKLAIVIPPQGMRAGTWALFGFAIFWLGFIAFWTAGALGELPCNSPAEQDWLIAEINGFLASVPYSPSDVDLLPGGQ